MDHEPVLISTIAIGLTAAFIGGFVARRIGLPAIVGYIVAGIVIGPFTPGIAADPTIATQLAEIGVILLMFGVGIHFSFRDLLAVRAIVVPGAAVQIAVATILGTGLGVLLGFGVGGGLVLGLAISVASTVVLLRALEDRNELDTQQGRIAVGWLIVEDLFTVVVLVLLPLIAPLLGATDGGTHAETSGAGAGALAEVAFAIARVAIFAVVMVVAGARVDPVAPAAGRAPGVTGAVHAGGPCDRARDRLRRVDGLRCVLRARRIPGRSRRERVGHESSGGRRRPSTA